VVWAQHLWASGQVGGFVASGNAVYTPYVEAEALTEGLVALGVPRARVWLEPRALHTDENIAYALRIAGELGVREVAVASDGWQASGGCAMVEAWSELACTPAPIDYDLVRARLSRGVPEVRGERVQSWVPLAVREAEIARETGYRRPPSLVLYITKALLRPFGLARPPRLPD
jgi:hypothetical protein